MAARHLIADLKLSLLGNVAADNLVYAGVEFIAVFAGEFLNLNNNSVFAVGNTQGGVPDFPCLFAEDCAKKSFLRGELGFALGGNLSDEDIAGVNLCADADNTSFVKILERVADIRNIVGDFFGTELRVTGFKLIFFNVDRCVHIISYKFFVDENCVLIVVALPGHKADEGVLAEAELAVVGCGAVGNNLTFFNHVADGNYRALIDAGALVGAHEFDEVVAFNNVVLAEDVNSVCADIDDLAGFFCKDADAGVGGGFIFHTGSDHR